MSRHRVRAPQLDGAPHRPWSSVNVRPSEKRVFDLLQQWWSVEQAADLSQWDAFSLLLTRYLALEKELPPGLRRFMEEMA